MQKQAKRLEEQQKWAAEQERLRIQQQYNEQNIQNQNIATGFATQHNSSGSTGQTGYLPNNANGASTFMNGTLHNAKDWQKPFGVDNSKKTNASNGSGSTFDTPNIFNRTISQLTMENGLEIGKNLTIATGDSILGKQVIGKLRETFTIGKVSAPNIGPAGTLEVKVPTTPKGVVVLKNVSKYGGGLISVGSTAYDIYVNHETYGGLTENFAKASAADIAKTVAIAGVGGAAAAAGLPVVLAVGIGGLTAYLVDRFAVKPFKESLK